MELKAQKKELTAILGKVIGVLNPKPTLPKLSYVLMDAAREMLTVTGTDLEISIRIVRPLNSTKEGKVFVPGRKLLDILREFPEAEIKLETEKETLLRLSQGRINLSLVGLKAEEFPQLAKIKNPSQFKVGSEVLKRALASTKPIVVVDENRPHLSGVLLTTEDGWLTAVATDTRRLARFKTKTNLASNIKFILPTKAAEIIRSVWEEETELDVNLGTNQAIFSGRDITLTTQIIDGNFPNYASIIPAEADLRPATVPVEGFLAALRRLRQLVSAGKNMVRLDVQPKIMRLSGEAAGVGEGSEDLEIDYQGEPITAYFNPDYLMDGLRPLEKETDFFLGLNPNVEKPSLLRPTKSGDYLYLIMPMRPV